MNGPCLLICNSLLVFRDEIEKKINSLSDKKKIIFVLAKIGFFSDVALDRNIFNHT